MAREAVVEAFARVLRDRRQKAGLTQEQLAFEAGVHPTYISLMERAQRNPSLVMISQLATALDTTMTSIVKQVESRSKRSS